MKRFLLFILLVAAYLFSDAQSLDKTNPRLLFNDHAEALTCVNYNDNNMPWNGYWTYTGGTQNTCSQSQLNNVSLSTTYKRGGNYSYRHYVQYTGSNDGPWGRGEWGVLSPPHQGINNEWRWAAISTLIDPNHAFESRRYQIAYDHKESPDNLETPFWLGIWGYPGDGLNGPRYGICGRYVGNTDPYGRNFVDLGPVVTGVWVDWLLERNWKTDNTGYMRFYKNGTIVWEALNTPNHSSHTSAIDRIQHGFYKWAWYSGNPEGGGSGNTTGNLLMYTDEIKFGSPNATYNDMLPNSTGGGGNTPPIVSAGSDASITLPTSSYTFSGSSASDPDGSITAYLWEKITGGSGTLTSTSILHPTVNGLTQGLYTFRLTVTDNNGAQASDEMSLTVNASSPTTTTGPRFTDSSGCVADTYLSDGCPSIALPDLTITAPATTCTTNIYSVHGDTTGYIQSYSISMLTSPGGSPSGAQYEQIGYIPTVGRFAFSGLTVDGVSTWEVTVTDNSLRTKKDTFSITRVAAANSSPTALAGNDTTVVFGDYPGTTSVRLDGHGTDTDGTIVSYAWSIIDGLGGSISNPSDSNAIIASNVGGVYHLQLTVTDNNGATDKDTVRVVFAFCNAGSDQAWPLGTTSTSVTGTCINAADTVDVVWTKISGTGGTITESGKLSTTITGLSSGSYVYELAVEYADGTIVTDRITVVIASPTTERNYHIRTAWLDHKFIDAVKRKTGSVPDDFITFRNQNISRWMKL